MTSVAGVNPPRSKNRWGLLVSEQVPSEILAMFNCIEISDDVPWAVIAMFSDLPDGRIIQEEIALGETVHVEWHKAPAGLHGYDYTASRVERGTCWWLAHQEQIDNAPDLVVVYEALGHWWEWWPRSQRLHNVTWYAPQKLDPSRYMDHFGQWLEPLPVNRVREMMMTVEDFGEGDYGGLAQGWLRTRRSGLACARPDSVSAPKP